MSHPPITRREFVASSAAATAAFLVPRARSAAQVGKKTFTILHTNDMHSNFLGMGPVSDYSPFDVGDDGTRGGYARLAGLIAQRRAAREAQGPVLVLDAGDYSMGTAFGAGTRETGGELRLMARMGYDATTFGNHEFDLGPDGLGQAIGVARAAGAIPALLASNTELDADDATIAELKALAADGAIRRYVVLERGGLRFGLLGVLGKEATFYATGGAATFSDAIEAAKEVVRTLRETERVDVVICLSHGGLEVGADGSIADGDDLRLARAVPGIDVVVGGHSHTELREALRVHDRTPVVQAGKEGECLGELVLGWDGSELSIESYQLHVIDDSIVADRAIADEIEQLEQAVSAVVFESRGYRIDQPLAVAPRDLPNTFTDIAASTLLANLVTDAFRSATGADIGFTANGMLRAGLTRGKSGVQTVYDVFCVAPLGAGAIDPTAGSALVTGYFTGRELKNLLEFCLVDNPAHPGEYFPRASGMRFRYDSSRPKLDVVTAIELGDAERGYRPIDIGREDERLYSLTCPLYLGLIVVAIPKYTKGALELVAKDREGKPLTSKVDALDDLRNETPYLLPPPGAIDRACVATAASREARREIKEWQAIMDHLRALPAKTPGELPTIPVDERAQEVRAIRAG